MTSSNPVPWVLSLPRQGQLDPQEMIDKMVEVVGADEGLYGNVWPPAIETLIKQIQERAWTLPMGPK